MAADEPAAQAADGAPTRSLARHISSVSVVSSAPADDPAAIGGPTPVEFPPSPLIDYDCTQHRDLVKRKKKQKQLKKKKPVVKTPASKFRVLTTPKAKTVPKGKTAPKGKMAPKGKAAPETIEDGEVMEDWPAELELRIVLKHLDEEPEGQPCDVTDLKHINKMTSERLMQIRHLKTGQVVQLTTRMFPEEKLHCALAVLEEAILRGYTKPQLERMKTLILKDMATRSDVR